MKRWLMLICIVGCDNEQLPVSHDATVVTPDARRCIDHPICEDSKTVAACTSDGVWHFNMCPADQLCHPCVSDNVSCAFCYAPPAEPCVPDGYNTASRCVDVDTARICKGTPSDGYIWVYDECPNYCHPSSGTLGFCV